MPVAGRRRGRSRWFPSGLAPREVVVRHVWLHVRLFSWLLGLVILGFAKTGVGLPFTVLLSWRVWLVRLYYSGAVGF